MQSGFHTTNGRYFLGEKLIGLDYSILDPIVAQITWAHEITHGIIALEGDFGQATDAIIKLSKHFSHLNPDEKKKLVLMLKESHEMVQEGFATLMQISHLRNLKGRTVALLWAEEHFTDYYREKFQNLRFAFDMSSGYRDHFTRKIPHLAMETGIRRHFSSKNALSDLVALSTYLQDEAHNPNARLQKIVDTLQYKPWLVTKPVPEIAETCGVVYNEPSTKEEVAQFLTYLTQFTPEPYIFTSNDIGDAPEGMDAILQVGQNVVIGNLNLNLDKSSVTEWKLEDFLFHKESIEAVVVNFHDEEWKNDDFLKFLTETDPEVGLVGFTRGPLKYIGLTSKEGATNALNDELKEATVAVKWGGYDIVKDRFIWSSTARPPDLVIYNNVRDMTDYFSKFLNENSEAKLLHFDLGLMQDHPVHTLLVKIDGRNSLHVVNTFGNKDVSDFIQYIKPYSTRMSDTNLRGDKRSLNNLLAILDFHWDIDWVETIINKTELVYRT